jgi:hypothetical protein
MDFVATNNSCLYVECTKHDSQCRAAYSFVVNANTLSLSWLTLTINVNGFHAAPQRILVLRPHVDTFDKLDSKLIGTVGTFRSPMMVDYYRFALGGPPTTAGDAYWVRQLSFTEPKKVPSYS